MKRLVAAILLVQRFRMMWSNKRILKNYLVLFLACFENIRKQHIPEHHVETLQVRSFYRQNRLAPTARYRRLHVTLCSTWSPSMHLRKNIFWYIFVFLFKSLPEMANDGTLNVTTWPTNSLHSFVNSLYGLSRTFIQKKKKRKSGYCFFSLKKKEKKSCDALELQQRSDKSVWRRATLRRPSIVPRLRFCRPWTDTSRCVESRRSPSGPHARTSPTWHNRHPKDRCHKSLPQQH